MTDANTTIVWQPQPGPQTALLQCPVFEVFFGGARGGGKSDGMLGDFAAHASLYGSDAIGLCVRRERTQLRELIERSRNLYTPIGAKMTGNMWRFPNGARLTFAYLENDSDAEAYMGHSYSRLYVEEIGNFPNQDPIMKLMATIRTANPKVKCGFRATGNPGGPGHLWVKRRYIDPAPLGMKVIKSKFENPFTKEETTIDRVYIPSRIGDNRYINNNAYIARLQMSGSERLVKAWLHGDWSVIEGAFFDEWNPDVHVIPQFIIPHHWTRFMSLDWGSAHPFSVGWWAIVPERFDTAVLEIGENEGARYVYKNDLPRGALVRYREWYGCQIDREGNSMHNNIGLKLDVEELANGIKHRERKEPRDSNGRAKMAYRVAGLDLFKHEGGPSLAERMGASPYYQFWQPADNARVARKGSVGGWDMVRSRLKGEDGYPMMYFFENCVDAIRTIPAMQHDPDNLEDVNTESEDHCFVADTPILTYNGPQRIADLVGTTGRVVTEGGWIAEYRAVRLVKQDARVVRLRFSDGSEVTCTPDHGFLTSEGMVRADQLPGMTLSLFQRQSRNLMVSGITFAANTFSTRAADFILWSGNITMGLCRMVITSITGSSGPGMGLMTWPAYRPLRTSACMDLSAAMRRENFSRETGILRTSGTAVPRGLHGIVGITTSTVLKRCTGEALRNASNAVGRLRLLRQANSVPINASPRGAVHLASIMRSALASFAGLGSRLINIARPLRVAKSVAALFRQRNELVCLSLKDAGRADVYCLTVPSTGCFALGNGLIVANCPDEVRYACMSRPYTRLMETKGPDRIMSVGGGNQMVINDIMDDVYKEPKARAFERIK